MKICKSIQFLVMIFVVCTQAFAATQFHECVMLLDPDQNPMDSGGKIGALTSKFKLATYEEVPMIVSGSIVKSGILASKIEANAEMVDVFQKKFGGISILPKKPSEVAAEKAELEARMKAIL